VICERGIYAEFQDFRCLASISFIEKELDGSNELAKWLN